LPVPTDLSFCGFDPFSTPAVYIRLGFRATPSHQTRLPTTREGMHCYSYDGCNSSSLGSDPLSGSDSEASSAQSQRSVIILLDDSDDEEVEQPVHPLPSHRPKRPLPRSFSKSYHSPVKEGMAQGMETPRPEVYHTISCAPALRDKSLEVRRFFSIAISHSNFCRRNSGWNVTNKAKSPRGSPPNQLAVA